MRKGIWKAVAALAVIVPGGALLAGPGAQAADSAKVSIEDADKDAMKWGYAPASISVPAGTTVVWTNAGAQPHTVSANDKSFDSASLGNGDTFEFTFSAPGDFSYYCKPHPWMKAVVKVTGAAPAPSTPTTAAPAPSTPTTAAPAPSTPTTAPPKAAGAQVTTTTTAPATTTTVAAAAASTETTTTTAPAAAAPAGEESSTTTTTAAAEEEASPTGHDADTTAAETTAAPASSGHHDRDVASIIFGIGASLAVALVALKLLFTKSSAAAH